MWQKVLIVYDSMSLNVQLHITDLKESSLKLSFILIINLFFPEPLFEAFASNCHAQNKEFVSEITSSVGLSLYHHKGSSTL